ncbi:PAS domain S-box protein [Inquilinus sp. KBS0705]|nr:PAS domain S-box protein [Inquilinus sp. KBS0705]
MSVGLLLDKLKEMALIHVWDWENFSKRPLWARLLIPVALALLISWMIIGPLDFFGSYAPFLPYFGIIFFSACYGGSRSALVASLASAICAVCFIYPRHTANGAGAFGLLIAFFLAEALLITALFAVIELIQERYKVDQEKYKGIIEKNAEGFLMTDESGTINYVCSSVTKILGYGETELLGTPLQSLIHPDELKSFNVQFLKVLAKGSHSMAFLQRLSTKQGEWKWIEGCVNNMLKDTNIKRIVFNYRNVTERINQTKQQEDFVHMAAHELKTPITAMRGYLQLMQMNHYKEHRDADSSMLSRMHRQTDRLLNLIDEMLNVTRIRAGELQYHFGNFDMQECIQDVVDALQATTNKHKLILHMGRLPIIYGDRDRIGQVLTNLISNAIKYAPAEPEIVITALTDGDWLKVKVKDHGIGIPKEQQKKIFERFYRSESLPKNTYQGLGLGLYIAMDIIKTHGGKIGVESEVGAGSEFWFSLPLKAS